MCYWASPGLSWSCRSVLRASSRNCICARLCATHRRWPLPLQSWRDGPPRRHGALRRQRLELTPRALTDFPGLLGQQAEMFSGHPGRFRDDATLFDTGACLLDVLTLVLRHFACTFSLDPAVFRRSIGHPSLPHCAEKSGKGRGHERSTDHSPCPPPSRFSTRPTSLTRSSASLSLTIGNRGGTHRPVRKNSGAGGGPSEPRLRARLALARNRSLGDAPVGSEDATVCGGRTPGSCLGAPPPSSSMRSRSDGVGLLRAAVGRVVERIASHAPFQYVDAASAGVLTSSTCHPSRRRHRRAPGWRQALPRGSPR